MSRSRGSIAFAVILIAVGLWFLAVNLYPGLRDLVNGPETWPLQIVAVGVLFGMVGIFAWKPGFMVPACIVGGIGGLLFWQNMTGNWTSWAYTWSFIPGFVGVGLILMGLLSRKPRAILGGLWSLAASLVLFGVFAYAFSGSTIASTLWPVGLILMGLLIMLRPFRRKVE